MIKLNDPQSTSSSLVGGSDQLSNTPKRPVLSNADTGRRLTLKILGLTLDKLDKSVDEIEHVAVKGLKVGLRLLALFAFILLSFWCLIEHTRSFLGSVFK